MIKTFSAPLPARLAAAKGLLPLTTEESLDALIALRRDPDAGVAKTAEDTLNEYDPDQMLKLAGSITTPPEILGYLVDWRKADTTMWDALITNRSTPDDAIADLAKRVNEGRLLEAITINQQRLIRTPKIIEAILANPARTADAERSLRQIQEEFFQKEYGAKLVEAELEVQAQKSEAAKLNAARMDIPLDEIVGLDIDDYILSEFEEEFGVIVEDPVLDYVAESHRIFDDAVADGENFTSDRISLVQRILLMNPRERVKVALRGDREARCILARDSNRSVCLAVLKNPRITDGEIEMIAYMKNAHEQVLRSIATNRNWCKSYPIIHNLMRNPRTPISITLGLLPRLQTKDAKALSQNKNVPDVVRKTSQRIFVTRMQAPGH
jgi:hypothetical protein